MYCINLYFTRKKNEKLPSQDGFLYQHHNCIEITVGKNLKSSQTVSRTYFPKQSGCHSLTWKSKWSGLLLFCAATEETFLCTSVERLLTHLNGCFLDDVWPFCFTFGDNLPLDLCLRLSHCPKIDSSWPKALLLHSVCSDHFKNIQELRRRLK